MSLLPKSSSKELQRFLLPNQHTVPVSLYIILTTLLLPRLYFFANLHEIILILFYYFQCYWDVNDWISLELPRYGGAKNPSAKAGNARDEVQSPGPGRSLGGATATHLPCLKFHMYCGGLAAKVVHGLQRVTWLSDWSTRTHTHTRTCTWRDKLKLNDITWYVYILWMILNM